MVLAVLALTACGGGGSAAKATPKPTTTPTPAATATLDVGALAALFAGTYQGSWTNTTFNSTGPVTAVVAVDRAALTVTANLTIGGNVFGGSPPAPETFSGKIDNNAALKFSGHSPTFGDFTVSSLEGGFQMTATNVPNARIDHFVADGSMGTTIKGSYKVFFKDGTSAVGTFSLARS
jgi:hypothetical protein